MHDLPPRSSPLAACGLLLALVGLVGLARGYRAEEPSQGPRPPPAAEVDAGAPSEQGARLLAGGRLDLNRATAADLELLPRIGPRLADRIVEDRARRGAFRSVDELERVPGIGPRTIERLRPFVEAATRPAEAPAQLGR